jgi:hypothetical protein
MPDPSIRRHPHDSRKVIVTFDGSTYSMDVAKAEEMLAFLEAHVDDPDVDSAGLPEFITAIHKALASVKGTA